MLLLIFEGRSTRTRLTTPCIKISASPTQSPASTRATSGKITTTRQYKDARTWRQRRQNLDANWKNALPKLTTAYMEWRYDSPTSPDPEVLPSTVEIDVLDIYSTATTAVIKRSDRSFAEDLVLHGFLGTSPLHPSLAISLKTLELFRCLRIFKPSFSAEAFTKLLCYLYYVPYRRHYRTAISDVFDIYLMMRRDVRRQVMHVFGRDAPDWRPQHACAACTYKLADEPPATFDRLVCMDGNNSLKRIATSGGREVADLRVYEDNDYFLPREYVDSFAGEVKSRSVKKPVLKEKPGLAPDPGEAEEDGDPTDGAHATGACASNWKAAAADEKKKMWAIYDETGIFASACRHSFILWIADMVRSGELAKYAIAMVDKISTSLPGKKSVGYDIGCEFTATVRNSSIGPAFFKSGSRFCVPAFHGYSHEYDCQVKFHPNRIPGMGLEDLETMERIFSNSNQLASVIRYASPYRRRALIALFFEHWDEERHASLAQMLYNNYRQALEIITDKTPVLRETMETLEITDQDLGRYLEEERIYFTTLQDEDPDDLRDILYVDALKKLATAKEEYKAVSGQYYDRVARAGERADAAKDADTAPPPLTFMAPHNGPTNYDSDLSVTRKLETRRRELQATVDNREADVSAIEVRFGIEKRWEPMDSQYQNALHYVATREYQRALGKLQRLVVQRLFELHKLNLAQTGYKARTYIAKNLQRRCQSIRTAVKAYNDAAAALNPPREPLDWSTASHYSFLEEFALLRDTRKDARVRDQPWATPVVRELMRLSERIHRAHEEVRNLNRELRRVHTSIRDEELLFATVLEELRHQDSTLFGAVAEYVRHRRAANARNMVYIEATYALPGFSGNPTPGHREGGSLPALLRQSTLGNLLDQEMIAVSQEEEVSPTLDEDDFTSEEITGLMDYLATLTM
ncbi:hypothetical protein C8Q76DRAFT_769169 [Earliella scabrosa]|nr:hypothetical protein C8Q76DRAFT_769169 [Earliella scabrosa]